MRKFVVNVNGNSYEVEVEEVSGTIVSQPVTEPAPQPALTTAPAAPAAAPAPQPAPAPAAPVSSGAEGAVKITAPMPGTILDIRVKPGDSENKGTEVIILEAMKMENEIMAPTAGVVKEIKIQPGATVNPGDALIVLG